jgi:hypothetical protein
MFFAVQEKQVEGEEYAFASAEQQVVEHPTARIIETCYFAVKDSARDAQVVADPLYQVFEVAERVRIP